MAAKKRNKSKAGKEAVTAKLRAMVEDVERWPLSDKLLKALEELEAAPEDDAPPTSEEPKKN